MIDIGCIVPTWNGMWSLADLPMGRVSIWATSLDEEWQMGPGTKSSELLLWFWGWKSWSRVAF